MNEGTENLCTGGTPANIVRDVRFAEKKVSQPPKEVPAPAPEQPQYRLGTFADGHVFKFTPHPSDPKSFVLFGPDKVPVGIIAHPAIANFICVACAEMMKAVKALQEEKANDEQS